MKGGNNQLLCKIILKYTIANFTIVWPQQTEWLWCLSMNFEGIRDPNHSKMVLFNIPPTFF